MSDTTATSTPSGAPRVFKISESVIRIAGDSPDLWGGLNSLLFKASFGFLGQTTGWCGLFRKLAPRTAEAAGQRRPVCAAS